MPTTDGDSFAVPRSAASVILIRERTGTGEVEVFLMRRHRNASFMSSAFVFPGGAADPGEDDLRLTAARELFEEVGVLLCDGEVMSERREEIRRALHQDHDARPPAGSPAAAPRRLAELLAQDQATIALDGLHYFAHWITPSLEKKRFSAVFYIALMPPGQTPVIDNREAVDEVWVTPAEALARSGELRLPPPQVRTFWELDAASRSGVDPVLELARTRGDHRHAVMPRISSNGTPLTILLPWDPEYHSAGKGEALAVPGDHPLAVGPSRFVLEDATWKHIEAPSSPSAD